ncbi:MAG: hypothetical protein H8D67_03300 [Deltaproteobacteria bacterium]|nr:hypothetical protein [Deltaproteobacteria bacterium]
MILIITSCSASKNDVISIPSGSRLVAPQDYLDDEKLVSRLLSIRESIFQDPRSHVGNRGTYAFDLYVKAGNAYRDLRRDNYEKMKELLVSGNSVGWFFLSGGYGIIHALEPAVKYQATFNRSISYQNDIPFTGALWKRILPKILDEIISKYNPEMTYVFGSRDYTWFIKQTQTWEGDDVIMLESTGSPGPHWLSTRINALVNHILRDEVYGFNARYNKFNKQ